jgi:hypothetical protein
MIPLLMKETWLLFSAALSLCKIILHFSLYMLPQVFKKTMGIYGMFAAAGCRNVPLCFAL